MKVAELAYFTDDVSSMTSFYRRLLRVDPVVESKDMAIFQAGDTRIFIHRNYEPGEGELPPVDHTALEVVDVDASCRSLEALGLTLEFPPEDYYWGRSAYLRDPDGHQIELIQAPTPEAEEP